MKEFPDFDIEAAPRRINEANRREDELIAARRLAAQEEARRITAILRAKDSGIRLIWGFGSAFEAHHPFRMDSDIDLALEGGDILRLLSAAQDSAFKVDFVDISDSDDQFARWIRERGTLL